MPSDKAHDTWTRRAFRNREHNVSAIKNPALYRHFDRYKRTVSDLEKVLSVISPAGSSVGQADYEHNSLSPVKSSDLLTAAEQPELDPFFPYFSRRLRGLFNEKTPSFAGISLNYLSQALCAFSMMGFIRREFPGVKIILGGGLVTSWLRNLKWQDPFSGLVDHLVAGPGEYQLLSILGVEATESGIQRPDYCRLPLEAYFSPGFILPYSASAGCYWNRCGFCPEQAEANPYLSVPARQVIEDLRGLVEKTGPALVHLLDNAISPSLLQALCEENIGIPWYGFARISSHLTDPAFCRALKQSGCAMLKLGIESGDQEVLDALDKGISVEMSSVVLKNLKEAGIAAYVYLLFGTPVETEMSAGRTLDFTIKHSDCIDFLNLAIFNMPVCGSTAQAIRAREFYEGDLSLYADFAHPHGWDRKRVRLFLEKEFTRHPAISAILKSNPPVFTSNHAPFFVKQLGLKSCGLK
jgi:radical SAM superfamily enzyme YgiQ (UPF0313 family)